VVYVALVWDWISEHATILATVMTAIATVFIAAFTISLAKATNQQGGTTLEALDLARAEFLATHRPKIIVREAILAAVMEGAPVEAVIHLANVGDSWGKIVRGLIDLEEVNTKADRLLLVSSVDLVNEIGDLKLAPGQSVLFAYSSLKKRPNQGKAPLWSADRFGLKTGHNRDPDNPARVIPFQWREFEIHLVGQFIYEDAQGLQRRTAFRRRLIPERQRFYRLRGEPDLDYAD
jgi:hypothetical protein